jgi:CO/xanthine dehydrogenase Mo-binding subunit/aerobic-type carbon monoxide dehydrogenase small subunit (CoxS/CutS family)
MPEPESAGTAISLTINGQLQTVTVDPATTLQTLLHHELGYTDVRHGCGEGVCGACNVLVEGVPKASCLLLAVQAQGKKVVTAEGLENCYGPQAALLRDHFITRQSFQCGYCSCGMIVSSAHHLFADGEKNPDIRHALSGNLCRCTGYQQIVEAAEAAASSQSPVLTKFPRTDLMEKMSADAAYPTDRHQPGTLIGRIVWSQWPSAKITAIDTSAAVQVPGVEAILTHRDVPGQNFTGMVLFRNDQPLLAVDRVQTMADAVALIAARTVEAAEEACQRIQVTYVPQTPITDVYEAAKPGSPKVAAHGNVVAQVVEADGDIQAGFQKSFVVVEGEFATSIMDHGVMEQEGGTGWMEDDTLVLRVPLQTPETGQRNVARMLGIAEQRVRIVAPRLGGSFGKYMTATLEGYLGLLVYKTGKPVRLVLGRDEMLQRRSKKHATTGRYKLGVDREGKFMALEADILADAGPYVALTPAVAAVITSEFTGAYEMPNFYVRTRGVLTNNNLTAPMRGYGSQQIAFGVESIVEKAACALKMDPLEIRKRNCKKVRTDGSGRPIPGLQLALEQAAQHVQERLGPKPTPPSGWLAGRGVSMIHGKYGFPYGLVDRFALRVTLDAQQGFSVECDISDSGTSVPAELVRTVAQELDLATLPRYVQTRAAVDDPTGHSLEHGRPPGAIARFLYRVIEGAQTGSTRALLYITRNLQPKHVQWLTKGGAIPANLSLRLLNGCKNLLFPYSRDSFQPRFASSRASSLCSNAVLDAIGRFKTVAIEVAAKALEVPAGSLRLDGNGVSSVDGNQRMTWNEIATHNGGRLSMIGESHNPKGQLLDPATGNQRGPVDFMDAVHGCDVFVNPQTGEIKIAKYVASHDAGYALNPEGVRGQIMGGIAMGIGQAILEKLWVQNGKILNNGFHDYLVPTILEMPASIEVDILESGTGIGPRGMKGIGESGAVASPIALANAVYDAVGLQPQHLPVTPDQIVELCDQRPTGPKG